MYTLLPLVPVLGRAGAERMRRAWGCRSKCAFTTYPNVGMVKRKGESKFCLAFKSQLEIRETKILNTMQGGQMYSSS